jgi:RNA 3'-terminal phosphate cyclase (ATP)
VEGATLGSLDLTFRPGVLTGGVFDFDIGTAGSTTLVLQTVAVPLLCAPEPSTVTVTGGTHNDLAPPFDFLDRVFGDQVRRMGGQMDFSLETYGFHPAGGGRVVARLFPSVLRPLHLLTRGDLVDRRVRAIVSRIPAHVATREVSTVCRRLDWPESLGVTETVDSLGPGNVVMAEVRFGSVTEIATAFGRHGVSAERVAQRCARDVRDYLSHDAPAGPHLADQLLLPCVVAGGGAFRTPAPTLHTTTNLEVIRRFTDLPIAVEVAADETVTIHVGDH